MYTDDLASLEVLTEDAIVEQLQKRYAENQIYTYIGDILVAVNPFTDIGIYTTKVRTNRASNKRCLLCHGSIYYSKICFFSRRNKYTKAGVDPIILRIFTLWPMLPIKPLCIKRYTKL